MDGPRLLLRPLKAEDVPGLAALAHAQGRNLHRSDYERFVGLEGASGLVLLRGEALEGAVTVMRYFEHGFLGPIVLQEGPESVGLAIALASAALEGLQRDGVPLVETLCPPHDVPLLTGLGFRDVGRVLIHERDPGQPPAAPGGTRPLDAADLLDVGALDASAAGHGRKEYLWALREAHPEGARILEEGGEVRGYVLLRRSRRGWHLGPLVTRPDDADAAARLLRDALVPLAGWPVVALAPEGAPWGDALREAGFAPVGELRRLRAGHGAPGDPKGATEWLAGGRITG